jgi:iron complex outermembrane receptor protein
MTSAWADTTPGGGEVAAMEEVVVTATRDREPVRRVAANVTVISAQQIEASGASSLIDVLGKLESVNIRDYSGSSPQSIIDIRGFGGDNPFGKVLVMLDGRRLNRPDMASVNWLNIPLGQIDRVEGSGGRTRFCMRRGIGGVLRSLPCRAGEPVQTLFQMGSHGLHDGGSVQRFLGGCPRTSRRGTANWGIGSGANPVLGGGLNLGYEGAINCLSAGVHEPKRLRLSRRLTQRRWPGPRQYHRQPQRRRSGSRVSAPTRLEAIRGIGAIRSRVSSVTGHRLQYGFVVAMDKTDMRTYSLNPKYILEKDFLGRATSFPQGWMVLRAYRKDFFCRSGTGDHEGMADLKKDGLGY